jgi:hypothetical protein
LDEVQNTSILATGRPGCYRRSISCLPLSQMRDTFRESIAKRFSALALFGHGAMSGLSLLWAAKRTRTLLIISVSVD